MESNSLPLPRKSPYKLRFISATANHSPLATKSLFIRIVIGRAVDDVMEVRTNSIRKLQIYAYIIHFMSYK